MKLKQPSSGPVLRVPGWQAIPGLVHGFLGRLGGASAGPWESLNLSVAVGDEPTAVAANWTVVQRQFPDLGFVRIHQVHGTRVLRVSAPAADLADADGMMTQSAGLGLVVSTADCVPILMVAARARVAMALHAGWRGTLGGIAEIAVASAEDSFGIRPQEWHAALGPAIGGCCYEVEIDLGRQFERRWGAMPDAWQPGSVKGRLDLRRINRRILASAGVPSSQIEDVGPCTACHQDEFFSHRGSGGRCGRQVSVVGWAPA